MTSPLLAAEIAARKEPDPESEFEVTVIVVAKEFNTTHHIKKRRLNSLYLYNELVESSIFRRNQTPFI